MSLFLAEQREGSFIWMKKTRAIGDILKVSLSNIAVLLSGVLVGFLLPKIIGVTGYGYYKTYTLYATYVGMFHFGISDGIYLKYGGTNYEDLNRSKFRYYTRLFSCTELVLSILLASVSIMLLENENRFIFLFLSIYLVFHNLTNYFQVISQSTSRFKELSSRNILQSACISMMVLLLWICHKFIAISVNYRDYIILYSGVVILLALWYLYTYRDIAFGKVDKADRNYKDIIGFIASGFPLMLANLCTSLILTLDRQFVNILFDTETYAIYAFAYNMLALVTTATSAISTVLYPKLKQMDVAKLKKQYTDYISVILCLIYGCLCIYFPLNLFVNWFLPKYSSSLSVFRTIFPGLAISSAIMIVMHNYYKALGKTNNYFFKSVVTLVVSGIANGIAYTLFHSTISISVASIITMVFWYLFVEHYFIKTFNVKWLRNLLYLFAMMSVFYLVTVVKNHYLALVFYFVAYIAITSLFFRKNIRNFLDKRKGLK